MKTRSHPVTRNLQIDTLKGLAILLVVIGHAIQSSTNSFDNNLIFRYIYSFHMPLFMFLSGYVTYGKEINLTKKFTSLVIPFVSWYLIGYVLAILFVPSSESFWQYIIKWIMSPDWGLWFLWAIFLNTIITKLVIYFVNPKSTYSDIVGMLIACILVNQIPTGLFGVGIIKWQLIFFGLGYLAPKYYLVLLQKTWIKLFSVGLFIVLGYFWRRTEAPYEWSYFINWINPHNLPFLSSILLYLYTILVPVTGILAAFSVTSLKLFTPISYSLSWLGQRSFEVYVTHQKFLIVLGTTPFLILISSIIATTSSLFTAYLLKRNILLKKMLYGYR